MRILVADETNNEPDEDIKFFIYGGVIFDPSSIKAIGDHIKAIRDEYGIQEDEKIKFNLRSRPKSISPEQHTEIKNRIIDLAIEHNAIVIINCVLHDLAKNKEKAELQEMTSATVFRRFNDFCNQNTSPGIVLADQWPCENGFQFLEKCQLSAISYESGLKVELPWVYGFAQVSDNSTTLMCVADIVLGAFRYCINYRDKTNVNTQLMPKIAKLLWHKTESDKGRYIWNLGLNTSPRDIIVPAYKKEYNDLKEHIVTFANK